MRVISQDGTLDIPYEQVIIQRFNCEIYFLNKNLTGVEQLCSDMVIAEYSTEEKAEKAMEMLRKAYVGMPILFQNVEITEDVVKQFEKLKNSGIIVQTMNNEPSKVEYVNNCIFQFPKDDKIEVET